MVRAGHPLAGSVPSLEQLSKARWLLPTSDVTLRTEVERMSTDARFGALDVRVETDTSATLMIPLLRRSDAGFGVCRPVRDGPAERTGEWQPAH